jgi:hypothetical protein
MKKLFIVLIILISSIFLFGCTSTQENQALSNEVVQKWSEKVSALGEPIYEKVTIASGYEILPFPGLGYNGLRDNYQAFYATNNDYTFAIYASPSVVSTTKSFEEVKEELKAKYTSYGSNVVCQDISSTNWLTKAQTFKCNYYLSSINADYKSVIFYRDNKYIETILGVWGTSLGTYEYIFDEFNQKAVSWK